MLHRPMDEYGHIVVLVILLTDRQADIGENMTSLAEAKKKSSVIVSDSNRSA